MGAQARPLGECRGVCIFRALVCALSKSSLTPDPYLDDQDGENGPEAQGVYRVPSRFQQMQAVNALA